MIVEQIITILIFILAFIGLYKAIEINIKYYIKQKRIIELIDYIFEENIKYYKYSNLEIIDRCKYIIIYGFLAKLENKELQFLYYENENIAELKRMKINI